MKAFKGFKSDMTCRDFQYEEGKEYSETEAKVYETGFHACKYPLGTLRFYAPADSVFREVEIDPEEECSSNGIGMYASRNIFIGRLLSIGSFVYQVIHGPQLRNENLCFHDSSTGVASTQADEGNQIALGGESLVAANTDSTSCAFSGVDGCASSTGLYSLACTEGTHSIASNTGDCSISATASGYSVSVITGKKSVAFCGGPRSVAVSTGCSSASAVEGEGSIAVAIGLDSKAKGKKGSWLVLTEARPHFGRESKLTVQCFPVDGYSIKEDTYYTLKNGIPVEVE